MNQVTSSSRRSGRKAHLRSFAAGNALASVVLATAVATPLAAADFLRGDANGDGIVSAADASILDAWLYDFGAPPKCLQAADADADETLYGSDSRQIISLLVRDTTWLPAPWPEPGPGGPSQGQGGWLDCDGGPSPVPPEDPSARLEVLDAVAPGGSSSLATITIALSNRRDLAGFAGTISASAPSGLFVGSEIEPNMHQGAEILAFDRSTGDVNEVRVRDGKIRFVYLPYSGYGARPLGPNDEVPALAIHACVAPGTPAGEYPLTFESTELVDLETLLPIRPATSAGTLTLLSDVAPGASCPGLRFPATEFVRGDVNADGRVSIADVHALCLYSFMGGDPECVLAGDADNDGTVGLLDASRILDLLILGGPLPAPFPEPGPDLDGDRMGDWGTCRAPGGGSPLEDPAARLRVLDAVAPGGDDGMARIVVELSASRDIAGCSASIVAPPGLLSETGIQSRRPLVAALESRYSGTYAVREGRIALRVLADFIAERWIPAGEDIALYEVEVCLQPGTPAGDYPLTLQAGELADYATGQAIDPLLVSGRLRVERGVEPGADCFLEGGSAPPSVRVPPPATVNARYKLGSVQALPGGAAVVPFRARADDGIQGLSLSVDFDESVLQATGIDLLVPPTEGFSASLWDNADQHPGNAGIDEGYAVAAVVFSFTYPIELAGGEDHEVYRLRFRVDPETEAETTELRFLDGAHPRRGNMPGPVINALTVDGTTYTPETADSFVFVDGRVQIIPDVTMFIRGDSNDDSVVDLSDAQHALGHLFLGAEGPRCPDAADSNDDGKLDISDPILTLSVLFLGLGILPPPSDVRGYDPTPDDLAPCGVPE